jgi:hypothetical protein
MRRWSCIRRKSRTKTMMSIAHSLQQRQLVSLVTIPNNTHVVTAPVSIVQRMSLLTNLRVLKVGFRAGHVKSRDTHVSRPVALDWFHRKYTMSTLL